MSSEDMDLEHDFFLREVPDVRISNVQKKVPLKPRVKVEMQTMRLSDASQKLVMDTLKYVHGPDFKLTDVSEYKDKNSNLANKFWMERGNLVIQGVCDYSVQNNNDQLTDDRLKTFALMRLESYGFHKNHCEEALNFCQGDAGAALELLYTKYFDISPNNKASDHNYSEDELLEQRSDERSVLTSIYENAFEERIPNTVWMLTLKLDYLVRLFSKQKPPTRVQKPANNTKKPSMCRGFIMGHCKYGEKCRFSHKVEKVDTTNDHLNSSKDFQLEVRFPKNSQYPFEAPYMFLKTDVDVGELTCLHICRKLLEEAQNLAESGIPSIYSVVTLLQNEEEMTDYLKSGVKKFIDPKDSIFPKEVVPVLKRNCPSHYQKGAALENNRVLSWDAITAEDERIVARFRKKCDNSQYLKMLDVRKELPAWNLKKEILEKIGSSQVVVISGETGCGKSTQIPQFILDDWLCSYNTKDRKHIDIICTQPRRISALGVAERVAEERAERVGNTVGYQIRLESKISTSTRLTFCTTGILLRRLESDPTLASVTHVVVDEVHERSEESDFLLLILKDLLPARPDLKIVLMSATMNSLLFSSYFEGVPTLEIPGRTFPVEQIYLEDILERTRYVMEENSEFSNRKKAKEDPYEELESTICEFPKDSVKDEDLKVGEIVLRYKGYSKRTCINLYLMDSEKANFELIEHILMWIVSGDHDYPRTGAILIFLPGIAEITGLYEHLTDNHEFNPRYGKYKLVPLHSSLTSEEQAEVFKKPKEGVRKIVLSTNIAETSVTIDDCVFVIDSGKMKENRFDPNRNMESLDLVWVSRANAQQRRGRAGRVMPGVCIHLFTRFRYDHHLLKQPVPELQRVPLEQLILKINILPNFADYDAHDVLNRTLEPPSQTSIDSALKRLQNVGALDEAFQLTPLGRHLAALPVDVRIGKLMLFGAIFFCVDSVLTMAACLSYKSPFVAPFGKRDEADKKKKSFAAANSDHITVLRAYTKWQEVMGRSRQAGRVFARENYLSYKTLETLADIKHQFLELLVSIGFLPADLDLKRRMGTDNVLKITGAQFNVNGHNYRVLSAILCAALYPNVIKVLTPEKSFSVSSSGAVPKKLAAQDLRFKTKTDGYVFIHPSSVNFSANSFLTPYLVYQEKLHTSRIYVRDSTMIPLIPLVLFSGCSVNIEVHGGNTVLVLEDGWIMFQVEKHEVAEMIKAIRIELQNLLEEKIGDPYLNLAYHDNGSLIISTIVHIISND